MANKNPKQSKPKQAEFHGFVQCDLSSEQKAAAKAWVEANAPDFETLFKLVDSEYKVSFGYDNYHKTFQCSLTCVANQDPNKGWCLVARAPDPRLAFGMACYKHYMVLDQVWTDGGERALGDTDWG